jgi:hypothetical protein
VRSGEWVGDSGWQEVVRRKEEVVRRREEGRK